MRRWSYRAVILYEHKQKPMSYHLGKQQPRTFHRLVKGSGLNALMRDVNRKLTIKETASLILDSYGSCSLETK